MRMRKNYYDQTHNGFKWKYKKLWMLKKRRLEKNIILDPIFALFCSQVGNLTPGNAQVPCQSALNATSQYTNTTLTFSELESYGQNFVYKNIDPTLIKSLIAVGFVGNSISTKTIIFQFPLKPFEFSGNFTMISTQFGIKYKYEF